MRRPALPLLSAAFVIFLAPASIAANPVIEWSALMLDAIRSDTTGPTLSSRNLAILNLATYDAVNSITRTHQPYAAFDLTASSSASPEAAAVAAGREVMLALYPSARARTEKLYEHQLRSLGTGAAEGLAIGREAALTIVNLRAADGASTERPYIPSALPGQWQRTPPFFRPPLTPHWRHVQPFCLTAIEPFLPAPPPALESPEYAAALNEVKLLGGKGSPVRTEEESLIAVFWSDFSYTSMPPGHWHEIAASIASERGLSLAETARMFALLGMAQADAAIVCWEAKFNWNFWRPVTAIRRADEDGNPLTVPDKDWDHFLPSPPFPAYTSGHSTFSAASGRALTRFFGTDRIPFTAGSDSLPGVYRSFESVQACVDEIGMSRIYGGIHFSFDNFEGKRTGALVGDYVSTHFLLPLEALPSITIMEFAEGAPLLRVHGRPGHAWSVEWSADLALWEPIASGVASSGGTAVRDSRVSGQTQGFYRVREEPVAR